MPVMLGLWYTRTLIEGLFEGFHYVIIDFLEFFEEVRNECEGFHEVLLILVLSGIGILY